MTQIDLSKAYAIIDEHRGRILTTRKSCTKGYEMYTVCSAKLRLLNQLKKELALVSDADQIPLGL